MGKKLDRVEQAKREDRLREYRATGYTDAQIMVLENYSSVQAANRAVVKAVGKVKPPTVEQVRTDTDITSNFLRQQLAQVIINPPVSHSAIGTVIYDPRTCTCGVKDMRLPKSQGGGPAPHAKDCERVPVLDESVRVRAISELRKLGDQGLTMHGAVKRPPVDPDIAMAAVRAYLTRMEARDAYLTELERRHRAVGHQVPAITGELWDENDGVVE